MAKKTTIKKADQAAATNQEPQAPAAQTSPEPAGQTNGTGAEAPIAATQTTGEPIGTSTTDPDPAPAPESPEPTPPTKSGAKAIPKRNSKQEAARKDPETVNVPEPNSGNPPSDDAVDRQMNVDQAVAYAMTTNDPMQAARYLAGQHKLVDVTNTYKALEKLGHK